MPSSSRASHAFQTEVAQGHCVHTRKQQTREAQEKHYIRGMKKIQIPLLSCK